MTSTDTAIDVENIDKAHFECVFPTCGGICCKNGRPGVEPGERERIATSALRRREAARAAKK